MKRAERISSESLYALGVLRHDKADERALLEAAAVQALDDSEQALWHRACQWYENLSFLCGNHLTRFFTTAGGSLGTHTFGVNDHHDADLVIAQVADNRLVRPYETVVGMLTQGSPQPRVAPAGDGPDAEDTAKIAALALEMLFEHPLNMPERRKEAAGLMLICGSAFGEILYGDTGDVEEVPKLRVAERESLLTEGGVEEVIEQDGVEVVSARDFAARIWSPFHLSADPRATSMEDALWFRRNTFEDLYWIRERYDRDEEGFYPEALDHLEAAAPNQHALWWWSRFQDTIDSPQYLWASEGYRRHTEATAPHQTLFTIFDVRPTRAFPRGRTLVLAGKRLLYCGDARAWTQRYPKRWHGYAAAHWLKLPGRFLGIPLLSMLVPLQKRINKIDALVDFNRRYLSIGQWAYSRQHKIKEGTISGVAGSHIEYNGVPQQPPPFKVQNVPLPPELLKEREELIQAIDVISAAGMIAGDMAQSAARAGVILEFLREEKLRSKGPMISGYQRFLETMGQNTLIEVQENLTSNDPELTTRMRVAAKRYGTLTLASFTGESILDHHAVTIDVASELIHTPEAKKAIALEAAQYLGPNATEAQRNALFRAMGLDELVVSADNASVNRARRMVARIQAGEFEAAFQIPGVDQPAAMAPVFQAEILSDRFADYEPEPQKHLLGLFDYYSQMAAIEAENAMKLQLALSQGGKAPKAAGGEAPKAAA